MRRTLNIVLALITGCLLGFFGVLASVFSDGSMTERLITIGVILILYVVLGVIWGYFNPAPAWKSGLILGLPGALILLLYAFRESDMYLYFLIYIVLILTFCGIGAYFGSTIRSRRS